MSEFRKPNKPHQQKEYEEFRFAKARALLWQMRTGKSKACIDLACDLYKRGEIDRVLILAPNNVHIGWVVDQIPQHVWHSVNHFARFWSSSQARRKGWLEQLWGSLIRNKEEQLLFFAVNSEAARYAKPKEAMEHFVGNSKKGVLLIADESQDFKRAGSTRGRLARNIAKHVSYKRILTGSGFDNSPLNAWGQFEILKPGALGFTTYGAFEAEYAIKGLRRMGNRQFQVVEGYRGLDDLKERIAQWSSVVTRDMVPGLSELSYSKRYFEMTAQQQKMYKVLTEKLIMEHPEGGFQIGKAFEGGTLKLKLLQITNGFLIDEYGETVWFDENPRIEALREILTEHKEAGKKVIVWCRFHNDIQAVSKLFSELSIGFVQFYGLIKAEQRQKNLIQFMEDPNCLGFVGNPKAGGRGLNMSIAETIVWYSRDYDLEFKRQADERATGFDESTVGIIDLLADGTVDVSVAAALEEKLSISEMIDRSGLQAFIEGQSLAFDKALGL